MAGNVSEWVMDVYRPIIEQTTVSDHRSFRGNVYLTQKTDDDGFIAEKDSLGRITMVPVDVQENAYRRNYKKSDNINYLNGDIESQMGIDWNNFLNETESVDTARVQIDKWNRTASKYKDDAPEGNSNEMYAYGESSLVTDRTRVFKGGSWKDRAYWLNPGTRRFLDQDQSTDAIGFRCAMDRVGAPVVIRAKKILEEELTTVKKETKIYLYIKNRTPLNMGFFFTIIWRLKKYTRFSNSTLLSLLIAGKLRMALCLFL